MNFNVPRPAAIPSLDWPASVRLLMLAPHPDDFDAIGVTLRFFHERGNVIQLAVVSGSASGVLDEFCSGNAAKMAAREAEQRASLRFFGLPEHCATFMRLTEDAAGDPLDNAENSAAIARQLAVVQPNLVLLPHGADSNIGHQRVYAMFRRSATATTALLFRDPKTLDFRTDLFMPFDETAATWKRRLLLHHRSQEDRNRRQRGRGFDDRILDLNRAAAAGLSGGAPYAETFQLEIGVPQKFAESG